MPAQDRIDQAAINTLRFLAVDAVEKANSGHPGMPMGAAPMAYALWDRHLKHNPTHPDWFNRDRFVLSAGHGSALLYALLHLYGYDLPLDELKNFRQLHSKTPGHPEYGETPGVEVTTGPLGQGFANGVGMALTERFLADEFNAEGHDVIDHYTYAIVSDGDLMEGVSAEAGALAGHLNLGKLIYLYDQNCISIEGETDLAFSERIATRFDAQGWHVQHVEDGTSVDDIDAAISAAKEERGSPSLICVRTHIGYGSPQQDTAGVHGSPLGADDLQATKERLDWPHEESFYIPGDVLEHTREAVARGKYLESDWNDRVAQYRAAHPDRCSDFTTALDGGLPAYDTSAIPTFDASDGPMATRKASGIVLNKLAGRVCNLVGGSADLAPSTKTHLDGYADFEAGKAGRNIHFGVREHAMGSIANGMAAHGGVLPYTATFFTFSDYVRPALRLAALMNLHNITIFTHDSIALGEDGPTHQPVEHLMALRSIPNFTVLRPADANETAAAWRVAADLSGPSALVLTRQGLPVLEDSIDTINEGVAKGGYILEEAANDTPDVILIGTGSEVDLARKARTQLAAKGIHARVVSLPSFELFDQQPADYRDAVLLPDVPKVAIEAGITRGWHAYVGDAGAVIGLDRFGLSGPGAAVYEELGFTTDRVVAAAQDVIHTTLSTPASA
jgi:transketolase